MLGKRVGPVEQREAEHPFLDYVGRDSFYGFLATQRERLFRDEDFAALYCLDNGRPSVPPSLLATVLLLQAHDDVSDAEATAVGLLRGRRPRPDAHAALLRAIHSALMAICQLLAVDERPVRQRPAWALAGFRPRF